VVAHPVLEAEALPVSPLVLAAAAVCLVAIVARVSPWVGVSGDPTAANDDAATADTAGVSAPPAEPGLPATRWPTRAAGVLLLGLAIATGRLGRDSTIENLAPVLVMGLGWPLLVAGSALLGRVWAWLDPWDTLARVLSPLRGGESPPGPGARAVWWAIPAALAWMWLLGVARAPFSPRTVGTGLAVYTVVMLAGTLLIGRREWLDRADVVGLFFGWVARTRRGGLRRWDPPAGAEIVLGVLAGGLLFGSVRGSVTWLEFAASPNPHVWRAGGLLVWAGVAAGALWLAGRVSARLGARGDVPAAVVPVVTAIALATALTADRLKVSLQLFPGLASDPFGRGWDLFGTAHFGLVWGPTDLSLLIGIQVALLLLGGVAGALVARRRQAAWREAGPAVAAVCAVVAGGVLTLSLV
jgi:hypothetical protein